MRLVLTGGMLLVWGGEKGLLPVSGLLLRPARHSDPRPEVANSVSTRAPARHRQTPRDALELWQTGSCSFVTLYESMPVLRPARLSVEESVSLCDATRGHPSARS